MKLLYQMFLVFSFGFLVGGAWWLIYWDNARRNELKEEKGLWDLFKERRG